MDIAETVARSICNWSREGLECGCPCCDSGEEGIEGCIKHERYMTSSHAALRLMRDFMTATIRQGCGPCRGTGYADGAGGSECEYCGRPMAQVRNAINSALEEHDPGPAFRAGKGEP